MPNVQEPVRCAAGRRDSPVFPGERARTPHGPPRASGGVRILRLRRCLLRFSRPRRDDEAMGGRSAARGGDHLASPLSKWDTLRPPRTHESAPVAPHSARARKKPLCRSAAGCVSIVGHATCSPVLHGTRTAAGRCAPPKDSQARVLRSVFRSTARTAASVTPPDSSDGSTLTTHQVPAPRPGQTRRRPGSGRGDRLPAGGLR